MRRKLLVRWQISHTHLRTLGLALGLMGFVSTSMCSSDLGMFEMQTLGKQPYMKDSETQTGFAQKDIV